MKEDLRNISTTNKDIKKFGFLIGGILVIISLFLIWKDIPSYKNIMPIGIIFVLFGQFLPTILKPIYLVWMTFAVTLGWIMTRVILIVVFYLIVTPISLIAKLFRHKFLDLTFRTENDTYWNYRKGAVSDIEKQF